MEAYRPEYSHEAQRALEGMERPTAKRIVDKLDDAAGNPAHFFGRLKGREDYKLRIGDYRVLCLIFHAERMVFVESMDHRKNVYKRPG
jgi:mRNA interferase RelE/StbE